MFRLLALIFTYLAYLLSTAIGSERQQHRIQHGACSYTFVLPEVDHCRPTNDFQVSNTLQRDSPPEASTDASRSMADRSQKERPSSWQEQKLESLESAMENNTQWLRKVRWLNRRTETSTCISCFHGNFTKYWQAIKFNPITSVVHLLSLIQGY